MRKKFIVCWIIAVFTNPLVSDEPERVPPGSDLEGDYSFANVVRYTTGYEVIPFDRSNTQHHELLTKLERIAKSAALMAKRTGIRKTRANEVGTAMEEFVLKALKSGHLKTDRPKTKSGRRLAVGYPDFELEHDPPCYLELKTYNSTTASSTQRTFYYSPSEDPKITRDALHLLLAFQMILSRENGEPVWRPERFRITSLHNIPVKLKLEYNQGNRSLYDQKYLLSDQPVD